MFSNTRRPLTFIPEFLPDQTLYSWCSQYHEHSGNARAEYSNQQLFWSNQSGWGFHLTSHLNNFCAATRHIFGSPEDIIKKRTTLPAQGNIGLNSRVSTTQPPATNKFSDPAVISSKTGRLNFMKQLQCRSAVSLRTAQINFQRLS